MSICRWLFVVGGEAGELVTQERYAARNLRCTQSVQQDRPAEPVGVQQGQIAIVVQHSLVSLIVMHAASTIAHEFSQWVRLNRFVLAVDPDRHRARFRRGNAVLRDHAVFPLDIDRERAAGTKAANLARVP